MSHPKTLPYAKLANAGLIFLSRRVIADTITTQIINTPFPCIGIYLKISPHRHKYTCFYTNISMLGSGGSEGSGGSKGPSKFLEVDLDTLYYDPTVNVLAIKPLKNVNTSYDIKFRLAAATLIKDDMISIDDTILETFGNIEGSHTPIKTIMKLYESLNIPSATVSTHHTHDIMKKYNLSQDDPTLNQKTINMIQLMSQRLELTNLEDPSIINELTEIINEDTIFQELTYLRLPINDLSEADPTHNICEVGIEGCIKDYGENILHLIATRKDFRNIILNRLSNVSPIIPSSPTDRLHRYDVAHQISPFIDYWATLSTMLTISFKTGDFEITTYNHLLKKLSDTDLACDNHYVNYELHPTSHITVKHGDSFEAIPKPPHITIVDEHYISQHDASVITSSLNKVTILQAKLLYNAILYKYLNITGMHLAFQVVKKLLHYVSPISLHIPIIDDSEIEISYIGGESLGSTRSSIDDGVLVNAFVPVVINLWIYRVYYMLFIKHSLVIQYLDIEYANSLLTKFYELLRITADERTYIIDEDRSFRITSDIMYEGTDSYPNVCQLSITHNIIPSSLIIEYFRRLGNILTNHVKLLNRPQCSYDKFTKPLWLLDLELIGGLNRICPNINTQPIPIFKDYLDDDCLITLKRNDNQFSYSKDRFWAIRNEINQLLIDTQEGIMPVFRLDIVIDNLEKLCSDMHIDPYQYQLEDYNPLTTIVSLGEFKDRDMSLVLRNGNKVSLSVHRPRFDGLEVEIMEEILEHLNCTTDNDLTIHRFQSKLTDAIADKRNAIPD